MHVLSNVALLFHPHFFFGVSVLCHECVVVELSASVPGLCQHMSLAVLTRGRPGNTHYMLQHSKGGHTVGGD